MKTKTLENGFDYVAITFDFQLFAGNNVVVPSNAETNMMTTQTESIDPLFKEASDSLFIDYHKEKLVFPQYVRKITKKLHDGLSFTVRVKHRLKPKNTRLEEGMTPEPSQIEVSTISADIEQHGNYIMHTDLVENTSMVDIVNLDRELLADQAAEVENALVRDDILAADSIGIYYADKVDADGKKTKIDDIAELTIDCKLTVDLVKQVVKVYERNNIRPVAGKDYVWFIHPDQKYDLTNDPRWESMHQYTDPTPLFDGEIGRISGMRFVETSTVLITKDGAPIPDAEDGSKYAVYHSIVLGADAVAELDLGDKGTQMIVKGLGSAGTADPLNQRATTGWKKHYGLMVTDALAVTEVLTCSSDSETADETEIVYEDPTE